MVSSRLLLLGQKKHWLVCELDTLGAGATVIGSVGLYVKVVLPADSEHRLAREGQSLPGPARPLMPKRQG